MNKKTKRMLGFGLFAGSCVLLGVSIGITITKKTALKMFEKGGII